MLTNEVPQMLTKCIYDLDGLINCSTITYFVDITEYGHCHSRLHFYPTTHADKCYKQCILLFGCNYNTNWVE